MAQAAESTAHGQAKQAHILEPEKQSSVLHPLPRINVSSTTSPQLHISASQDATPLPATELTSTRQTSPVHAPGDTSPSPHASPLSSSS